MGPCMVTHALMSRAQTKWQVCNPSGVAVERLPTPILTHLSALHDDLLVLSYVAGSIPANQGAIPGDYTCMTTCPGFYNVALVKSLG